MMLDERKIKILQAIIQSYITNAEPIGSRTISKKFDLGVSSATIRNEMSDLEELGYLVQPHTSAGRIPSDKGYRLYVNRLLESNDLGFILRHDLKNRLINEIGEIDQLIYNAARILSKVTNYTSLAIAPQIKKSQLKHIQLIPIDDSKILVVIVTDSGIVKNTVLRTEHSISSDHLNIINNFLNIKLKGLNIGEIGAEVLDQLIKEIYDYKNSILDILPTIVYALDDIEGIEVFADGVNKIFNFPEYNDVEKARDFISFIENKPFIIDMMLSGEHNDIEISIGNENAYDEIKNCSVITATYSVNGKTIGKIGVIGPTRMDYSNVISVVRSLSLDLNEIIKNYFIK
ncbi:heat-inducible transcription repressor HrcA [Proteiniborus ethanoligenes]|uniref:Heat-inducible transcription repressor HrcA n=1 Tax=Proteiniborus ethanoligenes TaxID=415015 RepID=A0A1H3R233_9FIRM|nr:heat-inducible transcriptional repressor HrcA [Proteiniborus ethanoligenes]TAH63420.1 MAG: heat-inducible transcription repressor HrcA [Gottschalkiaceae bacterium]SDZ19646.1 heat-inducible transcription repressor HrcA [Proteiniborus ethanoligenes]